MPFASRAAIAILVALAGLFPVWAQGSSPSAPAPTQFFSGIITALTESDITVTRTVLGKESATRTFAVTQETRIEGKPRIKARVTVRYVSGEGGDRAVHIIVRTAQKK